MRREPGIDGNAVIRTDDLEPTISNRRVTGRPTTTADSALHADELQEATIAAMHDVAVTLD